MAKVRLIKIIVSHELFGKKEAAANAKNGEGNVYSRALILLVIKVTQFNEQRVVECKY